MKTYQDWLEYADKSETDRMQFVRSAINEHKSSGAYQAALYGEDYFNGRNTTIKRYEKYLFNAMGQAVPDYVSANHKIASRFFYRSVTQAVSVLLGNGITWDDDADVSVLGDDFDRKIIDAGRIAQVEGAAFLFFNVNHVEVYKLTEFVPLWDEEDGQLKAGIRFWQIADNKPLRATLFELDGYTEYMWTTADGGQVKQPKRAYVLEITETPADGAEIDAFVNYPSFPVVPCYANDRHETELTPIRSTIDAFDLINAGYANDIDDANLIYWTIQNAGGMSDFDIVEFLDKMRKLHAANLDDDAQIQAHTVDVPFQGREAILDRLEKQLYKDAMALNTYDLSNGAVTATQIEAAYEPLNEKLDILETEITDAIERICTVAGIDAKPTYTRSIMINRSEEIQAVVAASMFLDAEYVTEKVLTILGDKDQTETVLANVAGENVDRFMKGNNS